MPEGPVQQEPKGKDAAEHSNAVQQPATGVKYVQVGLMKKPGPGTGMMGLGGSRLLQTCPTGLGCEHRMDKSCSPGESSRT